MMKLRNTFIAEANFDMRYIKLLLMAIIEVFVDAWIDKKNGNGS